MMKSGTKFFAVSITLIAFAATSAAPVFARSAGYHSRALYNNASTRPFHKRTNRPALTGGGSIGYNVKTHTHHY
jgi:hypothetical protein